jgi:hypothetical protein
MLVGSASQANTTSSTTCVITHGLTILTNDVILLYIDGGGSGTNTYTWPSGFGVIPGISNVDIASGFTTLGMNYKIAGGSEPSSYTITSSSDDFQTGHIRVYRGRNVLAPFTAVATTASTGVGAWPIAVAANGLTSASGDDIVLLLGATGNSTPTSPVLTGPTGFIDQGSLYGGVTFSPVIAFADLIMSSGGPTGTLSATWSNSGSGGPLAYGGYVLSLAANPTPQRARKKRRRSPGGRTMGLNLTEWF